MGLWKVIKLSNRMLSRLGIFIMGLLTMLNLGSVAAMAWTMALSLLIYAAAFGWKFAVGFVALLFVHEIGHLIAARVVGLRTNIPLFVPFIGAVVSLRQAPRNAKMEANIAIGGPAMGTISALICLMFYLWTDSTLMLVLAYTACALNLFNLIPCAPLDGGRIAAAISPHMWWLGSIATALLFFYTSNIFLLVIFLFSLVRLWRGGDKAEDAYYYQLNWGQRIKVAFWYFGLLAVLGLSTLYVNTLLP